MPTTSAVTPSCAMGCGGTRSWRSVGCRSPRPGTTSRPVASGWRTTCVAPAPYEPASKSANSSLTSTHVRGWETGGLWLEEHFEAAGGDAQADGAEDGEVGDVQEHGPGELTGGEAALERDALVERRATHDPLQPRRVLREREERRREQEHRDQCEVHEVEVGPRPHEGRRRDTRPRERERDQDRSREREDRPPRADQSHEQHRDEEDGGVDAASDQRPQELAA